LPRFHRNADFIAWFIPLFDRFHNYLIASHALRFVQIPFITYRLL
jgi:hypothetical protein